MAKSLAGEKRLFQKSDLGTAAELERVPDGVPDFAVLTLERGEQVGAVGESGALKLAQRFTGHKESMRHAVHIHDEGDAIAKFRIYPEVLNRQVGHDGFHLGLRCGENGNSGCRSCITIHAGVGRFLFVDRVELWIRLNVSS